MSPVAPVVAPKDGWSRSQDKIKEPAAKTAG
jgi:hypothetical protein